MATFLVLLTFGLTHLLAVMSPGPSFIVTVRTAAAQSRRAGIWVAFGMAAITLVWALAAWFGLSALFAIAPWLYTGMKIAGGAYLVYLAIQLWRHAGKPVEMNQPGQAAAMSDWQAFRLGVLTQTANPKVAVFFGSIFVALLPQDPELFILAAAFVIVFLNEFFWYALVALVMAAPPVRRRYISAKAVLDRVTGTFLGLLGIRIAID